MTPRRRRSLSCALVAAMLLPVLAAVASAPAAAATTPAPPNLAGVWNYEDDVFFRIAQDPGSTSITTTIINDTCTSGPRNYMLTGTLDGVALNGTMQRCDEEDDILVTECGLDALWETPFTANVTDDEIVGERRGEYYIWDTDANGSAVNCTLDYYFQAGFRMTRVDCGIKTFEQLAEHHIADASKRADEIALAQSFEASGERLKWTDGQLAPGGFKEKVDALSALLVRFGYTATPTSAYRPILYQAHFADLYICGLQLRDALLANPELAPALAGSVAAINAEVGPAPGHKIVSKSYTVAGLTIKLPFVCWREPIANCPHTNERGADLTVVPDDSRSDWIGSMLGMCRPYLFKDPPDRPHWEYLGPDPFSTPKCSAVGRTGLIDLSISGNSPVNLLLEDSNGDRIGYDPATQSAVNNFGSDSYYSGPGTQPQVIELSGYAATTGAYTVTGVGTGSGPYTVDFTASDFDGVVLDRGQVAGVASLETPIATLSFTLRDDYSPPDLWTKASVLSSSGTSTSFAVESKNATHTVAAAGGDFNGLMFSRAGNVIAVMDDGAGGSTRITVPKSLLSGDFEVRVDGAVVPHTRTEDASGTTVTFNRPAGAEFITVEGASGTGSSSPSPAGGDLTLILVGAVLAAVGVVGALVYVSRRNRKQPGAPPGAPPGAGPPPAP